MSSKAVDVLAEAGGLLSENQHFRAVVETTPECVKLVAPDGTLLFMNESGVAMIEAASADELLGKNIFDLIVPEDRERFREFNERICGGEKGALEFEVIGLKGTRCLMESHSAPLRYPDGTIVHLAITRNISDRSKSERVALLLSAIVDSSDDAIISKDLNGIITSWNKSAERLFGYTAAEALGQSVALLLIPSDRQDEESEILARLRRGERVDHFETVRKRKNGSLFDISLTISPVKDRQGRIIGASKIARDISDRKRSQKAIHGLNDQLTADLAALMRMQQLSTRLLQLDDFPQLLNEIMVAAIEITGADMGTVQLLEDGELKIVAQRGFAAPYLDFFACARQDEAAWGVSARRRERVIVEDVADSPIFAGKPSLPVMLAAQARALQSTPLVTRGGQILGMLSTHYRTIRRPADRDLHMLDILGRQTADLIERKRAEAALLSSERRFRQLADSMPQIVWTASAGGQIDYCNERWYEFTGFLRDEPDGWELIIHPDDAQLWRNAWKAAVESGRSFNVEHRLRDRRENRWRWFIARALPIHEPDGTVLKWFGSCTDIDEQKRVQEDLRRANVDLEQFAFTASHDLQEPLRTVKIYSELLAQRYEQTLDEEARKFIRFLRIGATRMEVLVRDLLSYTRLSMPEEPVAPADANEALQVALGDLAGAVAQSGARITSDSLPSLRVHATHLQQLFLNIVGNAIKYRSPERPPEVHISAEHKGGDWVIAVRDNGIGIEAEYKENIFGLFTRLHSNDRYSGTGIGLAICQRIVDRYHGRIWLESEPGQGSTFRFSFPV
jgi:PAS domain S-box-containing protein